MERTRLHPLVNILTIAILTMICVGEGWEDMEDFGLSREAWLGTFLDMRKGGGPVAALSCSFLHGFHIAATELAMQCLEAIGKKRGSKQHNGLTAVL